MFSVTEDDEFLFFSQMSEVGSLLFGGGEHTSSPFVPTSPWELFLAFVLAFPSILFLLYLVVVLYRCVCTRNYAEWRSSMWEQQEGDRRQDFYTQVRKNSIISLTYLLI